MGTAIVELYGREPCCLCHEAREVLLRVQASIPFELREFDIDDDPELQAKYFLEIPVVVIGGEKAFIYRVDEEALRAKLLALEPPA